MLGNPKLTSSPVEDSCQCLASIIDRRREMEFGFIEVSALHALLQIGEFRGNQSGPKRSNILEWVSQQEEGSRKALGFPPTDPYAQIFDLLYP